MRQWIVVAVLLENPLTADLLDVDPVYGVGVTISRTKFFTSPAGKV